MGHVELLDCTLRDGAYLLNKKFGNTTIAGIIEGLISAKIDIIEIGFLQNEGFGQGMTVYRNTRDASKFIPADKGKSQIAVLADYSRYDIAFLDENDGKNIDIIRECFFKHERFNAIKACRKIKEKGYKVFVQPVDILGYSDLELIEFIDLINEVEPYGVSIVDTFGSMYQEDLHRVFEIMNHNLNTSCKLGFHSHNNLQLSNALSQEFIRISTGKRRTVIDGTISGMGRGAGNTPIELVAQYLVSQLGYDYDMDVLLDLIDTYMDNIRAKCSWGYSTSYFVAGCYGAHVNNIDYLANKNSIRHKDMRLILNKIGADARKRYNYDLLEKTYLEILNADIDDSQTIDRIRQEISDRRVLILIPGKTLDTEREKISNYIEAQNPVVITVNFIDDRLKSDYVYMNNVKRYRYWSSNKNFLKAKKILTSNILGEDIPDNAEIVSFTRLVKCGWDYLDNSAVMLFRLLDEFNILEIAVAGFDGYETNGNYANDDLEVLQTSVSAVKVNQEVEEMLHDYYKNRKNRMTNILFITPSRFEKSFQMDGEE